MDSHVGSKGVNLWKLSRSLGPGISVPPAVALPFACLEYVLRMPENSGISSALAAGNVDEEAVEAALLQVCTVPTRSSAATSAPCCYSSLLCSLYETVCCSTCEGCSW